MLRQNCLNPYLLYETEKQELEEITKLIFFSVKWANVVAYHGKYFE